MFLIAVIDVEVLDTCVQQLELRALVLVVPSAAEPAFNLALDGTVPS